MPGASCCGSSGSAARCWPHCMRIATSVLAHEVTGANARPMSSKGATFGPDRRHTSFSGGVRHSSGDATTTVALLHLSHCMPDEAPFTEKVRSTSASSGCVHCKSNVHRAKAVRSSLSLNAWHALCDEWRPRKGGREASRCARRLPKSPLHPHERRSHRLAVSNHTIARKRELLSAGDAAVDRRASRCTVRRPGHPRSGSACRQPPRTRSGPATRPP